MSGVCLMGQQGVERCDTVRRILLFRVDGEPRCRAVCVVLDMDREQHTTVVPARVQIMLDAGSVDEVLEETHRLIRRSTLTYARRQRTWFNGVPGVRWFSESAYLVERKRREHCAPELLNELHETLDLDH